MAESKDARAKRLAEELRKNLRRRKAQAREAITLLRDGESDGPAAAGGGSERDSARRGAQPDRPFCCD